MSRGKSVGGAAVERLLAFESAGGPAGTEAARRIHAKLAKQLSPLLGDLGFAALFARTVKLTRSSHPALPSIDAAAPPDVSLEQLCAFLAALPPTAVGDVIAALLSRFITLLSTFIGERLTWKLLNNAWPEVLPTEPPSGENP